MKFSLRDTFRGCREHGVDPSNGPTSDSSKQAGCVRGATERDGARGFEHAAWNETGKVVAVDHEDDHWLLGAVRRVEPTMLVGLTRPSRSGPASPTPELGEIETGPLSETAHSTSLRPPNTVLGFGGGLGFNPVLLAAMSDVEQSESGLASGVVNTSFMMGGALGLAVLASVATSRTDSLRGSGHGPLAALNGGYHTAFLIGAVFAAAAAALGAALLRPKAEAAALAAEPA